MASLTSDFAASNEKAFAAWSRVYDSQVNPLLCLEERYLKSILPPVEDKDVLDLGCGTGRWLTNLNEIGTPKTLVGIDGSLEMLSVARTKQIANVSLVQAQLPRIPLQSKSTDLCIASFVFAYVPDLRSSAREIARVLRDGSDLFITDMHPETAAKLGWQRSFTCAETKVTLANRLDAIRTIVPSLERFGLHLVASYELPFGQPEYSIFQHHHKEDLYHRASGEPAICILHFKRSDIYGNHGSALIQNAKLVIGAEVLIRAALAVDRTTVATISARPFRKDFSRYIDLSGYTIFPGLINAHDHLEFALFPRLGAPPYKNATQWALDIQDRFRDTISLHKQVPKSVRLWWGALRNLLCGVTTVCHHNPFDSVFNDPAFPIKIVADFGWAHSLAFAEDVESAYAQTHPSHPFILHACEGVDSEAANEFTALESANIISERTALVHGLALTASAIERCNRSRTSLISCPSSNHFLFGAMPTLSHLNSIERLAIGSDSPLSAAGDMLDEVRFCHDKIGLTSTTLLDCVTRSPARILRLGDGRGRIAPEQALDVFAVRNSDLSPDEHLATLSWRDIELVIVAGRVRLASTEMLHRLPRQDIDHLSCLLIDNEPRWLDAPIDELFHSAAEVLGNENISLNGRHLSIPEQ